MTSSLATIPTSRDLSYTIRYADDLPSAAFDPRVTVVADLDEYTCGACAVCWDEPGTMRITYSYTERGFVQPVDVCDRACADEKLRELLSRAMFGSAVYALTLHIPCDDEPAAHLADVACEGQPGCTAPVSYTVTFSTRTHEARRECACREHLGALVDYALKFGDAFTAPTVSATTRELMAA